MWGTINKDEGNAGVLPNDVLELALREVNTPPPIDVFNQEEAPMNIQENETSPLFDENYWNLDSFSHGKE